jgi:hypothetical protein
MHKTTARSILFLLRERASYCYACQDEERPGGTLIHLIDIMGGEEGI